MLGIVLGDVAGKGPPAAILAASVQGMISAQAETGDPPSAIMGRVNRALVKRSLTGRFVTAFFGILAPDGKLTTCNAGHNYPILVRRNGERQELEAGGVPLGILETDDFKQETVQLHPGDTLVTYSDGISEAVNVDGEMFGEERLYDILDESLGFEAEALLDRIHERVRVFSEGHPQADDITLLILRVLGDQKKD
jgi:sigma-B regulation protein RsbU (phosphoserine phosphatase)